MKFYATQQLNEGMGTFQRNFYPEVKRADDLERVIRFFENQIDIYNKINPDNQIILQPKPNVLLDEPNIALNDLEVCITPHNYSSTALTVFLI